MVAIREVLETDDVVVVTSGGIVIRQHASEIRLAGRNTQGVRLIRLDQGDAISDVAAVAAEEEAPADPDRTKEKTPPAGRGTPDSAEKDSDQRELFKGKSEVHAAKPGPDQRGKKKSGRQSGPPRRRRRR